jgi:hypothetical protein
LSDICAERLFFLVSDAVASLTRDTAP